MSHTLTPVDPVAPPPAPPAGPRDTPAASRPRRPGFLGPLLLKLAAMAVVNAVGVFALTVTFGAGEWGFFAVLLVSLAVADYVYFSRRAVAAKYLLPGLFFLLVFQVYVVGYTAFVSFTNYGDGHTVSQATARDRVLAVSERRVPDSPAYAATVLARGAGLAAVAEGPEDAAPDEAGEEAADAGAGDADAGEEIALLLTGPDGEVTLGTGDGVQALEAADVTLEDGRAVAVAGWRSLALADLAERQEAVVDLRVPLDAEDPDAGSLRTQDGRNAYVFTPGLRYDEAADTLTDVATGAVYRADGATGFYRSDDGETLTPGWRVGVGLDNYARIFTDDRLVGPFLRVVAWTFAFAGLSVLGTFGLGVLLAIALDSPRMAGRRLYRSLLLLPYAAPSFMSMLLWAGFLNPSFGFVNQVLLGGADVPWLTDPWLAKLSVLVVNLWLGFPYMMLICTGALQSIPAELREAARVDGAGPLRTFRSIILPLLMVSVAPLLIASFAFNFNNFAVIYFVTGGGPNIPEASINVGETDLLIHVVYTLAFDQGGQQWGLACALSVLIFAVVATVSAVGFRRTRALEEIL
jgi:arabinogalactan oligomer/maltooligosaccharide transport system permease protein